MTERGVSEVLGFTIIFSMILLMTGIIYVGGAGELQNIRDNQQIEGVERAFVAIDSDVTDVVRDGAPSRSSTIRLNGGTLAFEEPVWVNVTVNGTPVNRTVRPLVYRFDGDARLAYVSGMVARSGGDGRWAVAREPPAVVVGGAEPYEAVLFPVIETSGTERVEGARSLTVLSEMGRERVATGERWTGDPLSVSVAVSGSPRAGAWERYLESEFEADCQTGLAADAANCSFTTDSFRSPTFPVDVSFN